jgi:3-isopropylmalate dehydratase small subunit
MKPFTSLTAPAAPLPIANLDTDQIIPKQFLSTVERTGLRAGLFFDMRCEADGAPKPDFVLNRAEYQGVQILVTGPNFGCGSSREHAPWALLDYGIRCVIAESFADIFAGNCLNNGILLVRLPAEAIAQLQDEAKGGNHVFSVDLESQTVVSPSGLSFAFDIDPGHKEKLLKGLDDIGQTLARAADIEAFEYRRKLSAPWLP